MGDKAITVPVPEARVAEFYLWFSAFLASEPGSRPRGGRGRGGRGHGGPAHHREPEPWSPDDAEHAAWLLAKLADPARALFELLAASPDARFSGNEIAARLGLQKGAHGVAGILAWPGRYCRRLGRVMPIATEGRADGGTDYYMAAEVAALFGPPSRGSGS
ncbi:MAG: DUF6416 domain-containing protein [Solirubrobacteraceae bacterium]